MSDPRRRSGLIVIGMTKTVIMTGRATLLMAPILVGTVAFSADLRGPMLDRIGRALADTAPGLGVTGQWRAIDVRKRGGS